MYGSTTTWGRSLSILGSPGQRSRSWDPPIEKACGSHLCQPFCQKPSNLHMWLFINTVERRSSEHRLSENSFIRNYKGRTEHLTFYPEFKAENQAYDRFFHEHNIVGLYFVLIKNRLLYVVTPGSA